MSLLDIGTKGERLQNKKSTPTHICWGAFLLLAFVFLLGCATTRSLPPAPPYTTAADVLHIITARYDTLRNLQSRTSISLNMDGIRENRASANFVYQSPDKLRIDIGTLGMSIMTAVSKQDRLDVYLPRENNHLVGQPEKVLFALTGVNLAYYNLNESVLGLPNLSLIDLPRISRFLPGKNQIFLELTYPYWKRKLLFEPRHLTLLEDHIFTLDGDVLSKRFLSDYEVVNGFMLPKHIAIHQGADRITIDVKSHRPNGEISNRYFDMRIPSDVQRREIK